MSRRTHTGYMIALGVTLVFGLSLLMAQESGQRKNPYTGDPAAIAEGRKIFMTVGCVGCHGKGGGGGMGYPLTDCLWKYGWDDNTLFRLISGQIENQRMPNFSQSLSEDEIWKVIAFVRTLNKCDPSEYKLGEPAGFSTSAAEATGELDIETAGRVCRVVSINRALFHQLFFNIPDYATTYVIVYPDKLGFIGSLAELAKRNLKVGTFADSPVAQLLQQNGIVPKTYPMDASSIEQPVADVLRGQIDAAVIWAPIAGFVVWDLDKEQVLSMMPLTESLPPPPAYAHAPEVAASSYVELCGKFVQKFLEAYGVIPAAKTERASK